MAREQQMVFLDVGNVLIDDDPFLSEAFRFIREAMPAHRPMARTDRFLGDVERALRRHGHEAVERMGHRCHGRSWPRLRKSIQQQISLKWWRLVRMVPGCREALAAIAQTYRLGLLANQPPQVLDCLEQWRISPLFDVVLLDSQQGVSKPDPAFFRLGLAKAHTDSGAAVMVGDRLDNDIIPARRVGMRAVLLWLDARCKGWTPEDEWGVRMKEILERLPMPRWDAFPPRERPLSVAKGWGELPGAIAAAFHAEM
jgi:FMN phosphatase YigB (HAD superfamily)